MFNVINVSYLIFFEGYVFGGLKTNLLTRLALISCVFQLYSCVTSIRRYNIGDEYDVDGKVGVATGLIAFSFSNIAYLYVALNKKATTKVVCAFSFFLLLLSCAIMYFMLQQWVDVPRPPFFKMYVGGSAIFHAICNLCCLSAHKKSEIKIVSSIITYDQMNRLLGTCVFLELLAASAVISKLPILIYPGTGSTFSIMVIVMTFVGKMDFMTGSETVTGSYEESQPIAGGTDGGDNYGTAPGMNLVV